MTNAVSSTESRALDLLGQGIGPEQVALALGVTPARISQLISDPIFAEKVFELRYTNLRKHNERDAAYDKIEDLLLEKLKNMLPLMFNPMQVLKAVATINAAKRRGSSTPESIINQQTVVNLVMPVQIVQQYTRNANNQVIRAGETDLVTIQSGSMNTLLDKTKLLPRPTPQPNHGNQNVVPSTA